MFTVGLITLLFTQTLTFIIVHVLGDQLGYTQVWLNLDDLAMGMYGFC